MINTLVGVAVMKSHLLPIVLLLASACGSPAPSPQPTSYTTALLSPVISPTAPQVLLSAEVVAERYVRALYAQDMLAMEEAFPYKPQADRDEYHLDLIDLAVQPITPEDAADRNPVSGIEYARVSAKVTAQGKDGTYVYTIGTRLNAGRRIISSVVRQTSW